MVEHLVWDQGDASSTLATPTKLCGLCKTIKPLIDFAKHTRSKDGRQSRCKQCANRERAAHYRRNKQHKYNYVEQRRIQARRFILSYLKQHKCVDCGENDPLVLEFDHIKGQKRFSIGDATRHGYAIKTIANEIVKCEVRCANCHRRKTGIERSYHKYMGV